MIKGIKFQVQIVFTVKQMLLKGLRINEVDLSEEVRLKITVKWTLSVVNHIVWSYCGMMTVVKEKNIR